MIRKASILITLLICHQNIYCDISDEMEAFISKYNTSVNVTSADVYESQKAGHLTGGGITIRNQIVTNRPISITLPKVDAGCGGIDLYTGAFSYINSKELINTLKSIGSSAQGFAFLLALETVSPMIANNLKNLQDMANKINSQNINSCELAAQLVGSVVPKESIANENFCRAVKSQNGISADWVTGRDRCSEEKSKEASDGKTGNSEINIVQENINIAWEVLKKQPAFSNHQDRAEYFMSLMGTIIKKNNEKKESSPEYLQSKIFDERFLNSIISGGEIRLYKCDEKNKCLFPKEQTISIPENRSWIGYVREKMFAIQDRILSDIELDEEEKQFVRKTRFPLYRIINVITAFSRENSVMDIYNIADIIAMDMFLQYFREAVDVTRNCCNQLKTEQWFDNQCKEYLENLDLIEKKISYYEHKVSDQLERELQLDQKIKIIEEELSRKLMIHK